MKLLTWFSSLYFAFTGHPGKMRAYPDATQACLSEPNSVYVVQYGVDLSSPVIASMRISSVICPELVAPIVDKAISAGE